MHEALDDLFKYTEKPVCELSKLGSVLEQAHKVKGQVMRNRAYLPINEHAHMW